MRAIVLGGFAVLVLGLVAVAAFLGTRTPSAHDFDEPEVVEATEPATTQTRAAKPATPATTSAAAPARSAAAGDELDARLTELERTCDALREQIDALESRRVEAPGSVAQRAPIDAAFVAQHRDAIAAVVDVVLAERDFEAEAQRVRNMALSLARTHGIESSALADDLVLWRRDCFDLTLGACPRGVWPERGTTARQALDERIARRTEDLGVLLTSRHGEGVSRSVVQYVRARTPMSQERQAKR